MTIDIQVQNLLRSNAVKEINFRFASLNVSGHGYWELSNCFADHPIRHRIRVTIRPQIVGPNAIAMYSPADDKLNLRSPDALASAEGRATVVHECTHAQMDLRGQRTRIRSEEGAAFIAEAWYLLASGEQPADPGFGLTADLIAIASDLRTRAIRARGAQVAMTSTQVNTARRSMARDYGYGSGVYRSDGIRGRRYRGP